MGCQGFKNTWTFRDSRIHELSGIQEYMDFQGFNNTWTFKDSIMDFQGLKNTKDCQGFKNTRTFRDSRILELSGIQ